jgi:S1-C subfamily serine protease
MEMLHRIILTLSITLFCLGASFAQTGYVTAGDAETFVLEEVGAVMVQQGDDVKIVIVLPVDRRKAAWRDVDLQPEDFVLMANGQRIRTVEDIAELYKALNTGDELKLGIRRGEEMRLIGLTKADPADLPRVQRMIMRNDGSAGSLIPVMGLGLVLSVREGVLTVHTVLPQAPEPIKNGGPVAGDAIVALNGAAVKDGPAFTSMYDELATGAAIRLTFRHENREKTVELPKPDAPAQPAIIRRGE